MMFAVAEPLVAGDLLVKTAGRNRKKKSNSKEAVVS